MANEGFFSKLGSLPGKRYDDFMEQTRRYQEGEIGVGDQMLQGGANAVGLLTDAPFFVAGEAVSAITPEFIKKGLDQVAEGIKDTDAAQAAIQYIQENPQMMKDWATVLTFLSSQLLKLQKVVCSVTYL